MSWVQFAGVFLAFFITHSIPVRPPVKAAIVRYIGARGFTIGYSILSLGMLGAVIWAAGKAPYVMLWPQAPWQHVVTALGMFAVCILLGLTLGRPNPFSFGGARNSAFDPQAPEVIGWIRHPVLAALLLWASLHLLPNGDLAHVILFGIFAVFAWLGRKIIDRRKQRIMGQDQWATILQSAKSNRWNFGALNWKTGTKRVIYAVITYWVLFKLHPYVIGVPIW